MTDTVSEKKRSEIMSHVRSQDSKIESLFRKELWKRGLRYRKNVSRYFGKPDIVLTKYKTAIFIDSCFWHGCKKHCRLPAIRIEYWQGKITKNNQRDNSVTDYYKNNNWNVIRVWEHDINKNLDRAVNKTIERLF